LTDLQGKISTIEPIFLPDARRTPDQLKISTVAELIILVGNNKGVNQQVTQRVKPLRIDFIQKADNGGYVNIARNDL
jgi:hypothetical protein